MDISVKDYIPQREPFLFIEKVIDRTEDTVTTELTLDNNMDVFKGHFPGNPIFPGVLQCEMAFQTGALLMALRGESSNQSSTAVVTRAQSAKFKNMARPGDTLTCKVTFKEMMANAAFMKAKITSGSKTILNLEFACAIIENE